jgi:hypothetical protein
MRRFLISFALAVSAVCLTAAASMASNWPGN